MSQAEFNPRRAIALGGDIVTASAFIDYITSIKFPALTFEQAKYAMRKAQTGETAWPDDMPEATRLLIQQAVLAYTKGYVEVEELIKSARIKAEAEGKLKAMEKERWVTTYQNTESQAIVQPMSQLLAQSVALALGDKFEVDGDTINLKEGVEPFEAFAPAFKNLNDLFDKSMELEEGFAKTEAKLAIAAEKVLGREWPLAVSGATRKEIIRIKKNKKAILRFEELGFSSLDVPIGTIRTLTEVNYDPGNEEVNIKITKGVITKFFEESAKKGSYISQLTCREYVDKAVPLNRIMRQQWDTYYLIADPGKKPKLVGSMGVVKELFDKAIHVIDRKTSCLIYTMPNGDYTYEAIPTYVGTPSREAIDEQEKPTAAKVIDFKPVQKVVPPVEVGVEDAVSDLDSLFD